MPHIEEPFQTIANGDRPRLVELLRNDPSLATARSEGGESPLLYAAYRGQHDIVDLLLESGAEPDVFEATTLGDRDRVAALLKEQANRAIALSPDGWTPLHLAAHFGHREVAALLLETGAEVNAASGPKCLAPGNTPLHAACAAGHHNMAGFLLENGADANAAQENGMTPLHIAAAGPNPGIVQLLLDHQADPDAKDQKGRTPLAIAEEYDRHDIINILRPRTNNAADA